MSDPLATYLHDHMAGSNFAVDLVESLRDQYSGEPLGGFAAGLLVDIEADKEVLQGIINRVGKGSADLKEAAAWLGEKVSKLKLSRGAAGGFGTFEALETLSLGILGKRALWRALLAIADADGRIGDVDPERLIARAEAQHAQVEEMRLQVARTALRPA